MTPKNSFAQSLEKHTQFCVRMVDISKGLLSQARSAVKNENFEEAERLFDESKKYVGVANEAEKQFEIEHGKNLRTLQTALNKTRVKHQFILESDKYTGMEPIKFILTLLLGIFISWCAVFFASGYHAATTFGTDVIIVAVGMPIFLLLVYVVLEEFIKSTNQNRPARRPISPEVLAAYKDFTDL